MIRQHFSGAIAAFDEGTGLLVHLGEQSPDTHPDECGIIMGLDEKQGLAFVCVEAVPCPNHRPCAKLMDDGDCCDRLRSHDIHDHWNEDGHDFVRYPEAA